MTSDPPPTTPWAPVPDGPRTMGCLATQAPSAMTMSRPVRGMASWRSRPKRLMSWVPVRTETLWPKKAYSPTLIVPEPTLNRAFLTTPRGPPGRGSCSAGAGRTGSRSQRTSSRAITRSRVDISASCRQPPSRFARRRLSLSPAGGGGERGPQPHAREGGPQAKRGPGRLHGRGDQGQQLGREGVQVDLLVQPAAERLDGGGGVMAAAVEAPVDQVLDPAAQRLGGGRGRPGGSGPGTGGGA